VPYLSDLEVCSRQGTIQIYVYLYLSAGYQFGYPTLKIRPDLDICPSLHEDVCDYWWQKH